jgi:hypothetical protein
VPLSPTELKILTEVEAEQVRTLIEGRMPILVCGITGSGKGKLMEWVRAQAGNGYVYPSDTEYNETELPEACGLETGHLQDSLIRNPRQVDSFFAWYTRAAQPLGKGLAFEWQLHPHEDVQESLDEILAAMGRHLPGHNIIGTALYVENGRLLKIVPFRGTKGH